MRSLKNPRVYPGSINAGAQDAPQLGGIWRLFLPGDQSRGTGAATREWVACLDRRKREQLAWGSCRVQWALR